MKLRMYEVFKERIVTFVDKIIYTMLVIVVVCLYFWVISDKYTAPSSLFTAPKEITAGESLSRYNKKQVTCEIPYVINHAVDFYKDDLYDEGDPDLEFYTHGYVGLDENLENPFFFFVPPDRKEEVDRMMEETQKIYFEGTPKRDIGSLQVTGYVRISHEKHLRFYKNALIDIYGNTDALRKTGYKAYVLDDQNVSFGSARTVIFKIKMSIFLIFLMCAIVSFRTVMGYKNRSCIRNYLEKYRINEYELNQEFVGATEVARNYWIGKNYTFYIMGNRPYVLLNNEIVLAYAANSSLNFYTLDKSRFSIMRQGDDIPRLLDYYAENFPRVVIGMNEEIHRLLMSDFDAFLDIKYRKN